MQKLKNNEFTGSYRKKGVYQNDSKRNQASLHEDIMNHVVRFCYSVSPGLTNR